MVMRHKNDKPIAAEHELSGRSNSRKYFVPRTVIILRMVSFLNDTASEMITPLLPLFLTATPWTPARRSWAW